MPPRKRPPPRRPTTPAMPTGHYNNPSPTADTTCMFDHCTAPGALYPGGIRCPAHKPDHTKYLAAWLGGFPKGETT